uniref:Geranylgeranyl transferase type-2 subunit alpha n=1 Tax=Syphacia muris TaxID=451379 RepID=A0A0N5AB09_9BILA
LAADEINAQRKKFLSYELTLTEKCLQKNSKSYGAWFHRGWAIKQLGEEELTKDLETTERFLGIDGRNFHCWDYRRFLATLSKADLKKELEFSTRLINENFSNYSSWHYRLVILLKLFANEGRIGFKHFFFDILSLEINMVSNAFFMDPEDQSAWMYTESLLKLHLNEFLGIKNDYFLFYVIFWPLFIYTLCLMHMDPEKHVDKILANFDKLKTKCDPKRRVMYSDMCSLFQVKNYFLKSDCDGDSMLEKFLNYLAFLSGLITSLDLSDNQISDLRTLVYLRRLKNLILNNNHIKK